MDRANGKRLEVWLHEVLTNETKGATVVLENGEEAEVVLEDDCLIAYTYEGEEDDLVQHARIRLVPEDD